MLDAKIKARILIRNKVFSLWLSSITAKGALMLSLVCGFYPLLRLFYPAKEIFPYLSHSLAVILLLFFLSSSLVFLFFYVVRSFFFKAQIFYLTDKSGVAPRRFFTLSQGMRYFVCHIKIAVYKFMWGALLFSPSALSAFVMAATLYSEGEMIKSIFIALAALTAFLFLLGMLFYVTVTGRYYLCDYLMYISPLQPVNDVISSSIECLKGRLISLLLKRISIIPWRLFSVFGVSVPFSSVFTKTAKAVLCDEIYKTVNVNGGLISGISTVRKTGIKAIGKRKKALS